MLKFCTAGESHGQALLAFISGLPAQLPIDVKFINHELHRRQLGYGRGGRQKIEKDQAEIFAGVRHGKTIGAPIALRIENRDWANWEEILPVEATEDDPGTKKLIAPRPGHADLAGSQKFDYHDARYILERASARETAARVAAGAFAKLLLREFGTEIASHTIQVGHVRVERPATWKKIRTVSADLDWPLRCIDAAVQEKMKAEVDAALKAGDTVGLQRRVDFRFHFLLNGSIDAAQRPIQVRAHRPNLFPCRGPFHAHVAHLNRVARNLGA